MSAAASDGGPRRPPFLPAPLLSLQAPGERLSIIRVRVRLQASAEPQGQRWLLSQEGLSSLGMCLPWERSPQPASGSPGSSPAQDSVGTPSSLPCRSVRWPRTLRVPGGNEDPPPSSAVSLPVVPNLTTRPSAPLAALSLVSALPTWTPALAPSPPPCPASLPPSNGLRTAAKVVLSP